MHEALITIAGMIALAHDHWRATAGRRRPLAGKVAVLEEQAQRLRAERAFLRARMQRVPPMRRPHYRQDERLEILWHAARYRLSIADTAAAFCVTRQRITNWRRDLKRDAPRSLPRIGTLGELVSELVLRLKAEWPDWGTRRIAGQIARLGVKVSRSSVQRIVSRGPRDPVEPERSMKEEYVRPLFLYRSTTTIDGRLERYRSWFNQERPHQGQRQRTPDDVYFARPEEPTRDIAGGMLHVRFHDGDRRLPVLRLRDAA